MSAHVREELQAYLDGELGAERGRGVAEHLLACRECRDLHDALKLGQSFARHLPRASAPDQLWDRISGRLRAARPTPIDERAPAATPVRESFLRRFPPRAIAAAVAFFIVSVTAGWVGLAWFRAAEWEAVRVAGSPVIGTATLGDAVAFRAGDVLQTDGRSRATVRVGDIGTTDVAPNSRLRVLAARPSEHRLALERGSIHARISAPPRLFIVETPTATAIDLGCEYTLAVDSTGASRLHVTLGWVALEDGQRRVLVPMGAIAYTRPGSGTGVPVYDNSSAALHAAVRTLEDAPRDEVALAIVMAEVRQQDAITLWHLLSRVDDRARGRIAMRLAELVSPPGDVRMSDVLALQERALDRWLEEIEPAWAVIREPAWRRVLSGLLEYVANRGDASLRRLAIALKG